jgi:hypothetical protein
MKRLFSLFFMALALLSFSVPAVAADITFAWDAYTAPNGTTATGFRLYQSAVSGQYVYGADAAKANITPSTLTTYKLVGVADGKWFFVVTAYGTNSGGAAESVPSNEITKTIDTTPPVLTAFSVPVTSTSLMISITSLAGTDVTGITGYIVREGAAVPLPTDAGWGPAPATYTFSSLGAKTLYAWAKDGYGNVSTSRTASTTITSVPITAPTGFMFVQ